MIKMLRKMRKRVSLPVLAVDLVRHGRISRAELRNSLGVLGEDQEMPTKKKIEIFMMIILIKFAEECREQMCTSNSMALGILAKVVHRGLA